MQTPKMPGGPHVPSHHCSPRSPVTAAEVSFPQPPHPSSPPPRTSFTGPGIPKAHPRLPSPHDCAPSPLGTCARDSQGVSCRAPHSQATRLPAGCWATPPGGLLVRRGFRGDVRGVWAAWPHRVRSCHLRVDWGLEKEPTLLLPWGGWGRTPPPTQNNLKARAGKTEPDGTSVWAAGGGGGGWKTSQCLDTGGEQLGQGDGSGERTWPRAGPRRAAGLGLGLHRERPSVSSPRAMAWWSGEAFLALPLGRLGCGADLPSSGTLLPRFASTEFLVGTFQLGFCCIFPLLRPVGILRTRLAVLVPRSGRRKLASSGRIIVSWDSHETVSCQGYWRKQASLCEE